jgi:hypothetical protein
VIGCGSIHARATSLLDVLELRGPINESAGIAIGHRDGSRDV